MAASLIDIAGIGSLLLFTGQQEWRCKRNHRRNKENTLVDTLPDGTVVTVNKQWSSVVSLRYSRVVKKVKKGRGFFLMLPDKKNLYHFCKWCTGGSGGNLFQCKEWKQRNKKWWIETGVAKSNQGLGQVELGLVRLPLVGQWDEGRKDNGRETNCITITGARSLFCDNTPFVETGTGAE